MKNKHLYINEKQNYSRYNLLCLKFKIKMLNKLYIQKTCRKSIFFNISKMIFLYKIMTNSAMGNNNSIFYYYFSADFQKSKINT
jgi:hypothetical protein